MAKLSWPEVEEIRRRRAAGEKLRELAAAYRVAIGTIGWIVTGKHWKTTI